MRRVKNKCCKCGHEWVDAPGALAVANECPKCSHLYWVATPIK